MKYLERSFADSKQNHGYRYAMYRGLKKNQNYTWLICAAQNMKNISIKVDKVNGKPLTMTTNIQKFLILIRKKLRTIKLLTKRKPQLTNNWGLSTI